MASPVPAPGEGLSQASAPETQGGPSRRADPRGGPGLPRNVLSERERRKRISVSCARLRALLPCFEGRREDMASVLEMAVQFLRLAGGPAGGPAGVDTRLSRQDLAQVATAQRSVDAPSGTTPGLPGPSSPAGAVEALGGPPSLPEPPALSSHSSGDLRLPSTWSPLECEESLRSTSGGDLEDGTSFLLRGSPDWWLESLQARGGGALSRALARSSPLDGTEPGFLMGPEHSSQELKDGSVEPWSLDMGAPGVSVKDEAEGIFADFLKY